MVVVAAALAQIIIRKQGRWEELAARELNGTPLTVLAVVAVVAVAIRRRTVVTKEGAQEDYMVVAVVEVVPISLARAPQQAAELKASSSLRTRR